MIAVVTQQRPSGSCGMVVIDHEPLPEAAKANRAFVILGQRHIVVLCLGHSSSRPEEPFPERALGLRFIRVIYFAANFGFALSAAAAEMMLVHTPSVFLG